MDLIEIAKSWISAINPTEEQKIIAEYRIEICNKCEFKKFYNIFQTYYCGKCGCPLSGKAFSPNKDSCPEKLWEK